MFRSLVIVLFSWEAFADKERFTKECLEQNNLGSCEQLHDFLVRHEEDEGTLLRISEVLCDGGRHASCVSLARWNEKQSRPLEQLKWLKKACMMTEDRGNSCMAIADVAAREKNAKDAKHWRTKACKLGHTPACAQP